MEKSMMRARMFVTVFSLVSVCGLYLYRRANVADRLVSMDEILREEAGGDLLELSGPARSKLVPSLIRSLKSREPAVRCHAARALGKIGPAAKEAIPVLLEMLSDTGLNSNVGAAAADAFGLIEPQPVPYFMKALKGGDIEARCNAAGALGNLGPAAKEAVPPLIEAAEDPDPELRRCAIHALGKIGRAAAAAVPVLAAALTDKSPLLRSYAAEALERIATPAALKALEKTKNNEDK